MKCGTQTRKSSIRVMSKKRVQFVTHITTTCQILQQRTNPQKNISSMLICVLLLSKYFPLLVDLTYS